MLSDTIRKRLRIVPFEPFAIRMNNGRLFRVSHPDFASVSPKGGQVTVYDKRDAAIQISALLVASVEPPGTKSAKAAREK